MTFTMSSDISLSMICPAARAIRVRKASRSSMLEPSDDVVLLAAMALSVAVALLTPPNCASCVPTTSCVSVKTSLVS